MHLYKKLTILILLGILPFSIFATTLNQAVKTAVMTHPDVLGAIEGRKANDYTVKQAKAGYYPTVDFHAGYGYETSLNNNTDYRWKGLKRGELDGEVRENIFHGFFDVNELKRTKSNVNSAAYNIQGIANDVALGAVKAFLNVKEQEDLMEVADTNIETHTVIVKMIQERTKAGLAREGDLAQAEARLSLAQANRIAILSDLRAATATYTAIIGQQPFQLTPAPIIETSMFPKIEQDVVTDALEHNPQLKGATSDVEGRRAQLNASRSLYMPRVDLVAGVSRNHNLDGQKSHNWDETLMVQLNWNLLHGGADRALHDENAEKLLQAQMVRDSAARDVIEQVKLSWASFLSTKEQLPYLQSHLEETETTSQSYADQFKLGKRTLLDLLDSENELFGARSEYVKAEYILRYAQYRVLHSEYALLPYLHVDLSDVSKPLSDVQTMVISHDDGAGLNYKGSQAPFKAQPHRVRSQESVSVQSKTTTMTNVALHQQVSSVKVAER